MVGDHSKEGIQFLYVAYAVEAREVSQQDFVYDVVTDELPGILSYIFRKDNFRVSAIIDIINKKL